MNTRKWGGYRAAKAVEGRYTRCQGRGKLVQALTGQQWFAVGLLAVVAFCVGGLVEVSRQAAYERRRACERHYR